VIIVVYYFASLSALESLMRSSWYLWSWVESTFCFCRVAGFVRSGRSMDPAIFSPRSSITSH